MSFSPGYTKYFGSDPETATPTEYHRKPHNKHDCLCPFCGAPSAISGPHRIVPGQNGASPTWTFLRCVGSETVEITYVKPSRKGKGIRHKYPKDSNRKRLTDNVRRRIVKATQLIGYGRTIRQVADELRVSESRLQNNRTEHRAFWDACMERAAKHADAALSELAGTPDVFVNNGKLVRIANLVEQKPTELRSSTDDPTLSSFLEDFYIPSRIEVNEGYANRLRSIVARFSAFFYGDPIFISELTETRLCEYLAAFRKSGASARTVNGHRQTLLTLWRCAYDHGLVERPPRLGLVSRIKEEHDPPEAWTAEEINRLFSAAANVHGDIEDIPAGQWWLSLLLVIYWTSSRIGSIMPTTSDCYSRDTGGLLVRKQKNKRPQWHRLPPSCCEAINATYPEERELLWPWPYHSRLLWLRFREMVEGAGLPCPKTGRQLFHRLRRTTLTLCAAVDPAIAQRQAGHADYATTLKHYIDPRLVHSQCAADVLPEPIINRS